MTLPVSVCFEDFCLSDQLLPEEVDTCTAISLDEDREYLESIPSSSSTPTNTLTSENLAYLQAILPPVRPPDWECDPAYHYDTLPSVSSSNTHSEKSSLPAPKSKSSRKRAAKKQKQKNKSTEQKLQRIQTSTAEVTPSNKISLASLNRRTRTSQPSVILQRSPQEVLRTHRVYTKNEVINGLKLLDAKGTMLVHLFPFNTLPSDIFDEMIASWNAYDSAVSFPNYDYSYVRGNYTAIILGCWYKSGRFLKPYMTAHYRGPFSGRHYKRKDNLHYMAAKKFQKANSRLFGFLEGLILQNYPSIHEIYKSIKVPEGCHKFAGLFAAVVINKLVKTEIHKDLGDIKGGICIIICWGDFQSGELVFSELLSVVPFLSGSIIVFRSAVLSHYNLPVAGDRYSMVFMTDKNLKVWSDKQK